MSAPGCRLTSLESFDYNCIAWAAGEDDRFWWPDSQQIGYWPDGVQREVTIEAFVAAYQTLGYERCSSSELEASFEKIVIYSKNGKPTHAARQLSTGKWTSKLGQWVDIEHDTPECVVTFSPKCADYGAPAQFMKRAI